MQPERLGIFANQNFAYALIAAFFMLYILSGFWLFGLLAGLSIFWAVALEFLLGTKKHGLKSELKETLIALVLAVLIWLGAGFLLQTPSPLNAIVSCSMLPHVHRGDMVLLRGDTISAPEIAVRTIEGIGRAEAYREGEYAGSFNGSLYAYCAQHEGGALCNSFVVSPQQFTERHGPLTVGYDKCEIVYPKTGDRQTGPCAAWLEIGGQKIFENLTNDVVVYQPDRGEYYSRVGDIIHRAFVKLNADGKTYFLTKGDNNPVFDFQVYDEKSGMGNRPVPLERFRGKIILSVPYLGYLKLFISPSAIITPEGCDRQYAKYG